MGLTAKPVEQTKKRTSPKFVMGLAALAVTAIVGTTSYAAAATNDLSIGAGSGYGGDTANVKLNLDVNGNHNIVDIILNLF